MSQIVSEGTKPAAQCLEARKISFRYGKRQPWIIRNLDFCVRKGTCVGLSAPSGMGV